MTIQLTGDKSKLRLHFRGCESDVFYDALTKGKSIDVDISGEEAKFLLERLLYIGVRPSNMDSLIDWFYGKEGDGS